MVDDPPPAERIKDPADIVWELPSYVQRQIGGAIVACSRLEHTLETVIWAFLKIDSEDGKMLTSRMEMTRRQAILKELIQRYPKEGEQPIDSEFWETLQTVIEARNKISHGMWVLVKGRPCIASSKWRKYKDFMELERYPYEKLLAVQQLAYKANVMLYEYVQRIGLPHIGFSRPRETGSPIHPPNHR